MGGTRGRFYSHNITFLLSLLSFVSTLFSRVVTGESFSLKRISYCYCFSLAVRPGVATSGVLVLCMTRRIVWTKVDFTPDCGLGIADLHVVAADNGIGVTREEGFSGWVGVQFRMLVTSVCDRKNL